MGSIHKDVAVAAPAERVWAMLRDVANPHRLFRGVLIDARLEGSIRLVTFANGSVVRERIVAIDEARRRVAYAVLREGLVHHNAAMQVLAAGAEGSRFTWTSDFLPDELAATLGPLIDQGTAAMQRVLENSDSHGDEPPP